MRNLDAVFRESSVVVYSLLVSFTNENRAVSCGLLHPVPATFVALIEIRSRKFLLELLIRGVIK
jgi:hypothetical protein